ncbi:MAG: response regulator transcription factor [Ignavibacteria bacterium]|jgi:DNA-binding LytR/AlgR family response regulator|nr:response regulator transcription factor [Ignavibacteria bacterium]MCU7504689.1 response regulator transcription factor [Ignavibacteria bacterium]MCU7516291.1 response regulator transcription factor [Ignavibacteria bacterium]
MGKILVIEDHQTVCQTIKRLLEKAGYEVTAAQNGSEGIRLALETLPEVIVCDIMMPGINGYEVLKHLHSIEKTSSIPFIFLTAKAEMTDLRLGMDLGADDYLVKPFKANDLLSAIKTRLEKRELIIRGQMEKLQKESGDSKLKSNSVIVAGNPPEIIKVSSIVYISANDGYTYIHTKEGKKPLIRRQLKEWEELLPKEQFLRIHHSTIINLEYMERVEKWFNSSLRIHMQNVAEPLEVSKRFAPKVKEHLKMKG